MGLTVNPDSERRRAVVGAHVDRRRQGNLTVHVLDQGNAVQHEASQAGIPQPGEPLEVTVDLPEAGDFAVLEVFYQEAGRILSNAREIVALGPQRPTAHLPFTGEGARVFVATDPRLESAENDGLYLLCHGTECGFEVDWKGPGVRIPDDLELYAAVCIVGDAWPLDRAEALRTWVASGGGLLICAPFDALVEELGDLVPLKVEEDGSLRSADPGLDVVAGAAHFTAERLMLPPDVSVNVGQWMPAVARAEATVTLRFTDPGSHPAVALREVGKGRVAAVATCPAWGTVTWDGFGQYHRACFGGLIGWVAGVWQG